MASTATAALAMAAAAPPAAAHADLVAQLEELVALAAIFPDAIDPTSAALAEAAASGDCIAAAQQQAQGDQLQQQHQRLTVTLTDLPLGLPSQDDPGTVTMQIAFAMDYPSHRPPMVHLASAQLSRRALRLLEQQLPGLFSAGSCVVFDWAMHLATAAVSELTTQATAAVPAAAACWWLRQCDELADRQAAQELAAKQQQQQQQQQGQARPCVVFIDEFSGLDAALQRDAEDPAVQAWLARSLAKQRLDVQRACHVCLCDCPVKDFPPLRCGHSNACKDCLAAMATVHISGGSEHKICCVDCAEPIKAALVKALCGEDLAAELTRLRRRRLEKAARRVEGSQPLKATLAQLDKDLAAVRADLKQHVSCQDDLDAALEDSVEFQVLREERDMVAELVRLGCLRCPRCSMVVLKTEGCNKVVCGSCQGVLCYKCGKDITKSGYDHFNDGNGCLGGLFEYDNLQRRAQDVRFFRRANLLQRRPGERRCFICGTFNGRGAGGANDVRCGMCRTRFCFHCGKVLRGAASAGHFNIKGCPRMTP